MAQLPAPPPPYITAQGGDGSGGNALLQEAEQEISSLRGELYATRRTGWAAQQALDKVPRLDAPKKHHIHLQDVILHNLVEATTDPIKYP